MEFNLMGGGILPDGALIGVGEALASLWRWLVPAARGAAGLTPEAADAALAGMRGGGGHAMRKLIAEGLIPDSGSLASRVEAMTNLLKPVLQNPSHTFAWRVGSTQATGFIGQAGGRAVFAFVANEGAYAGRVITSGVVSTSDWALWGLVP